MCLFLSKKALGNKHLRRSRGGSGGGEEFGKRFRRENEARAQNRTPNRRHQGKPAKIGCRKKHHFLEENCFATPIRNCLSPAVQMPPLKKAYFPEENRFATLAWGNSGATNPPGEFSEAIFIEKYRFFRSPKLSKPSRPKCPP